jgi:hypothetical protein
MWTSTRSDEAGSEPGDAGGPAVQAVPRARRVVAWLARRLLLLIALAIILRISGCMESLFYHPTAGPTPVPSVPELRGTELITFAGRDGLKLCGWFVPARRDAAATSAPAGTRATASRAPTILHVHGNAGNVTDHIWFTEYLPAHGFNVFIFDFRGYGQSEGRAWTRGPLIDDTNAALDYLLTRADVDPQRVGMYGQSLGGAIGLNVMAQRKEIHAAVIESAFASWRDEAASVLGGDPPAWWARALAWILIPDGSRPEDAIARIAPRPVLILHGDADRTVPVSHGRRLKQAGGANVELLEVHGGDHNTLRETNPEIEQRIVEFFRSHVGE